MLVYSLSLAATCPIRLNSRNAEIYKTLKKLRKTGDMFFLVTCPRFSGSLARTGVWGNQKSFTSIKELRFKARRIRGPHRRTDVIEKNMSPHSAHCSKLQKDLTLNLRRMGHVTAKPGEKTNTGTGCTCRIVGPPPILLNL